MGTIEKKAPGVNVQRGEKDDEVKLKRNEGERERKKETSGANS